MLFQSGRIHFSLECFFPDWNESFQSKLSDHGLKSLWQNSTVPLFKIQLCDYCFYLYDHGKFSISQQRIEIEKQILQILLEPEFWEQVSYPISGTTPEQFIPDRNDLFQGQGEKSYETYIFVPLEAADGLYWPRRSVSCTYRAQEGFQNGKTLGILLKIGASRDLTKITGILNSNQIKTLTSWNGPLKGFLDPLNVPRGRP